MSTSMLLTVASPFMFSSSIRRSVSVNEPASVETEKNQSPLRRPEAGSVRARGATFVTANQLSRPMTNGPTGRSALTTFPNFPGYRGPGRRKSIVPPISSRRVCRRRSARSAGSWRRALSRTTGSPP